MLTMLTMMYALLPAGIPANDEDPERTIFDFSRPSAEAWRAVNDDVMGGRSSGGSEVLDGRLVFTGETRLENNGGFSSIRSARADWNLEGAAELLVRVRGTPDRKYTMVLETTQRYRGMRMSYWYGFELQSDGWQVVRMPLSAFYPVFRGRALKGRELDSREIRSMGVMVYDKKAGPFRVEIGCIKARWMDAPAPADSAVAVD